MLKIAFLVKNGLDSFLEDVINGLGDKYEIKKVIVTYYNEIDEAMKWADICWFEWCDELIIYGSKLEIAKEKVIICRLHSYEAFTDNINGVNWNNVDQLICVSEFIRNNLLQKINIEKDKTIVIANGIDTDKYVYKDREKGFKIAYVGYINYKKGPMLLLHAFKAIFEKNNSYKLYIAGAFQDERYVLYFNQMIKAMGLENNIIFEGWQKELNTWLEDKNYILCSSLLESQNISVMQAMSKGIKPIIHNFVGAKEVYKENYLWNSIDEAVNITDEDRYDSKEYRDFIIDNFSLKKQKEKINSLMDSLYEKKNKIEKSIPLVTIGIINYNYENFLDKAVMSVLKQNYDNIEILIVDDFSTDGSIEKIRGYECNYKNIKGIYHTHNSGTSAKAAQEIVENARGEYFMLLSADDYFHDDKIIKSYVGEFINNNKLDYIYGNIQVVDMEGNNKEVWKYREYTDAEVIYSTFRNMGSGVIPLTAGMFKLDFYHKNKLTFFYDRDNRVAGDTLNTLIYLKYGWKRKYIDGNMVCYRHHDNNMTYDLMGRIKSIISVMEYVVHNFDENIYFPEIKWVEIESSIKESIKSYTIGKYYFEVLKTYYIGKVNIFRNNVDFDIEQLREYVQPLITVIEKYLDNVIAMNDEIKNIRNQLASIKIKYSGLSISSRKNEIYFEGQRLRESHLREYKNKYLNKSLKILIHSPNNGAWKYGFLTWQELFKYMGIEVTLVYDIKDELPYKDYDIFINSADRVYMDSIINNKKLAAIPHKIGLISKQDFFTSSRCTDVDLLNINLIKEIKYDFLIASSGSVENINYVFIQWIDNDIRIESIPFGFNPLLYYPENSEEIYDYFFVGTNSFRKIEETKKYLIPIITNFSGILRGTNWNQTTPELHPDKCRFFYNRAKINLNYHLQSQKEMENEVNERTIIISACGGFQLVDNPKILSRYYSEKDMAIAMDEKEYKDKFIYYLNKPEERHEMALNALVKTYENKYSLFHRLEDILNKL